MALPVHPLGFWVGRAYLVEHRGILTLVDTGTPGEPERILTEILRAGRTPEDVRTIVVSHSHGDHAGRGKALREATGAPIVAGNGDVDVIGGRSGYLFPTRAWARAIYGRLSRYERYPVDRPVSERTEIDGGLVVIPAPGHTPGHVAVFAPDLGALFAGDAVWNLGGFRPSWTAFTWDRDRNRETVRELADLPVEAIFPGHGPTIRSRARERLSALAG